MKRIIALALVLVVSVGLFVGCGSKKSSDAKKWVIGIILNCRIKMSVTH